MLSFDVFFSTPGTHAIDLQRRARRQMRLIRRILILIIILLALGMPYCIIITMDALSIVPAPTFGHRVGFLFVGIACGSIMLTMIYFSKNVRQFRAAQARNKKRNELKLANNRCRRGASQKISRALMRSETGG